MVFVIGWNGCFEDNYGIWNENYYFVKLEDRVKWIVILNILYIKMVCIIKLILLFCYNIFF